MSDISCAIGLICKHEGFSEKAYADPVTGKEPYTFGYGTQFYPDGSPVKQGQCCTKEKALEYLFHEVHLIDTQLLKLNLGLDDFMRQALISFIHSIGWEPFLYSDIVDCIDKEDFFGATQGMSCWIFDAEHKVIGGLIDRRREEVDLFLQEVDTNQWASTEVLLAAFRNYTAAPHQVKAIRTLEEQISPYLLSQFANDFDIEGDSWSSFLPEELDAIFTGWA
jgi:GH24 family phage-related lysozyme (muramidase)